MRNWPRLRWTVHCKTRKCGAVTRVWQTGRDMKGRRTGQCWVCGNHHPTSEVSFGRR